MDEQLIYTDVCSDELEAKIAEETGTIVIRRIPEDKWNVVDTMGVITTPAIELAVINRLDSISLMEISLLHFLCKPILVTSETINQYPAVANTVDYIDGQCSLVHDYSSFISWYKLWKDGRWT
jgi:hypothetical protein